MIMTMITTLKMKEIRNMKKIGADQSGLIQIIGMIGILQNKDTQMQKEKIIRKNLKNQN